MKVIDHGIPHEDAAWEGGPERLGRGSISPRP